MIEDMTNNLEFSELMRVAECIEMDLIHPYSNSLRFQHIHDENADLIEYAYQSNADISEVSHKLSIMVLNEYIEMLINKANQRDAHDIFGLVLGYGNQSAYAQFKATR